MMSNKRNVLVLLVIFVVFSLVATSCGGAVETTTTADQPVATSPEEPEPTEPSEEPSAPSETYELVFRNGGEVIEPADPDLYLPTAFGWYDDVGLDVTIGTSDGSAQAIQLLIAGDADFVQVVPAPLLSAIGQGADLVAVCTVVTSMNARIGVLPDSDITTMADLEGKTIGIASPTSSGFFFARAAAAAGGLDPDTDVSIVPAGFGPVSLQALQAGDVDALAYWTGYFADLEAATGVEIRQIALEETKLAPGPVIATRRSVIENQPEMVGRLLQTIGMAQEYAFANPESAIRSFWELYPEDKATGVSEEEALAESVFPLKVQLSDMAVEGREDERWCWNDPTGWQQLMDFLLTSGAIELSGDEVFDVSIAFTNDFIDAANDFDAEAIRDLALSDE